MSHANSTAHYNLPQYVGTDIINPLTDVNGAYEAIDTAIYEVGQSASAVVSDVADIKTVLGSEALDTASQTVTGAINELKATNDSFDTRLIATESDVSTLQTQMSTATSNITTLNTTVAGIQTDLTGKASQTALNTLTNKVGTGNLNTTAQNCVDAINEVLAEIPSGGSVAADDVTYDNTTSGLTATNAQAAIDELKTDIDAIPVYTDTTEVVSGTLTAGQTSVVLTATEQTIGANTLLSVYADGGLEYESYSVSGNAVTVVYEAQASDVAVALKIEN